MFGRGNEIEQVITNLGRSIKNETLPGHTFHWGIVKLDLTTDGPVPRLSYTGTGTNEGGAY